MNYLLDTDVVSEVRKKKPHGGVAAWLRDLRPEQLFIPTVVIGELQSGVEVTRLQDPGKAVEIERWIDGISGSFHLLGMDAPCFRDWARLMVGQSDDLSVDAMVAATARVHGLTVATRNERDFARLKVAVFNPFKYA